MAGHRFRTSYGRRSQDTYWRRFHAYHQSPPWLSRRRDCRRGGGCRQRRRPYRRERRGQCHPEPVSLRERTQPWPRSSLLTEIAIRLVLPWCRSLPANSPPGICWSPSSATRTAPPERAQRSCRSTPPTVRPASFFQGGPVAGPVGIAINPANDGVWIGDYGSAADGTAANDLLIAPTGQLKATFTDASTTNAASFVGVWGQGVSAADGTVNFYYGNAGNATTGTGGGDVWRLTPNPTGPANGQPLNSNYAQIATGQGQTPAGGNAATAAGPQGFAFAANGTLYETNDADNALYAIPGAATATGPVHVRTVYRGHSAAEPGERGDRPDKRRPAGGERQR